MQERMIREKQVCQLFGVSRTTARRWREQGCPAMKVGKVVLFPAKALKEWVQATADISINPYMFDRILTDMLGGSND